MIFWILVLAYMELYSLGVAVALYKCGNGGTSFLALIPFFAFFMVEKVTGKFKVVSIKVENFGKAVIIMFVVTLLAYLYMMWGKAHLSQKNIGPLSQLMYIPMAVCGLMLWSCIIASTSQYLFNIRSGFVCDKLVCALLITVPFLMIFARVNQKPVLIQEE